MAALKIILIILFIAVCVALTVIILFQEGNSAGLGSLSGQKLETYWSKNKKRSREGMLVRLLPHRSPSEYGAVLMRMEESYM